MTTPAPILGVTAVMLPDLDFPEQVDLCASLNVTHYVYRPRVVPDDQRGKGFNNNWGEHKFDLTPERLAHEGHKLADQLEAAGLTPFGTVPSTANADDDDRFKLHLDGAAAGRARNLRIGLPGLPNEVFDYDQHIQDCREKIARMLDLAQPYDLKLVIEMHAGMAAIDPAAARDLCDGFDPNRLGLIFDLPNFSRQGIRHAALTVSAARPFIDQAHVGGWTYQTADLAQRPRDEQGFATPAGTMCPLDDNDLHAPTWLRLLHDACPHAPLVIEDYTPNRPGADRLTDSAAAVRRALQG